jgi:two-component system, NtrC family, sensor histidine kinase HydH
MIELKRVKIEWMDLLALGFLAGLAILPPLWEVHKLLILLAIGILQVMEGWLAARFRKWAWSYILILKILLSTLLLDHTGEIGINSSYYPIYYLPVVTAALHFGPWGTLVWTLLASAAYCSYLYPALQEYQLTAEGQAALALRVLFFFLAAVVVNRFSLESRHQTQRYQRLAEQLAEINQQLERAQAQARRSERLAALGQLSAGLAHEIRNPLGVIKGSSEMLNQKLEKSDPLASELAGYISSEVNRLSVLVTRFLDFARPLQTEKRVQEITPLLDRALKSVSELWKGGPIKVECVYQPGLPVLPLDEDFCEQAFVNLIQNAYEAMASEGGTLRLEVSSLQPNRRQGVEVRITDSGPGVPAELREQIFNPFVTTKKTGVGLGLSIVSKIVDEHGGNIRLETAPGEGACFILFFPAPESMEHVAGTVAG